MSYYNYDYDDVPFTDDRLPYPDFFDFSTNGNINATMMYSSANFFRTSSNSNIEITVPLGADISPGTIWFSPNIYLPNGIFNSTRPITEIIYPNNKDALVLVDQNFLHDVLIQYKITKNNGQNFTNSREIRCTLVRDDGTTVYEASLYSNTQPDSGAHDYIIVRGHILHNLNDTVKIKLNIVQDKKNDDQSDSKLTIFRVSWNILGLNTSV